MIRINIIEYWSEKLIQRFIVFVGASIMLPLHKRLYVKKIIIISLFFAGMYVSHAQKYCDTLKLKVIKSYYTQLAGGRAGGDVISSRELDGAVINIDTLSFFYLGAKVINVSNDTFSSTNGFSFRAICIAYADTGALGSVSGSIAYFFGRDFFPNDTMSVAVDIKVDLLYAINTIRDSTGIDFEEISYWKMVIAIGYTDKDGYYSDSVINAGADTSIFYVVKTPINNIQGIENNPSLISVYPNPTTGQLTIDNGQLTIESVEIFDVTAKVVKTYYSPINNTIDISQLTNGIYFIAIYSEGRKVVKKLVKQ
jgi:hypothetical protein